MKHRVASIFFRVLVVAAVLPRFAAQAYSLDDYQREAQAKDPSLRAAQLAETAAQLNLRQAEGPSAIRIFSEDQFYDDTRPVLSPDFQGNRSTALTFALGLKQQSLFGLNWSLSQNLRRAKFYNTAPGTVPLTDYVDVYPQLELTVPLWRNFFGGEIKAKRDALRQQTQLQQLQARIDRANKEADIETTYYRFGIQQTLLELASRNLDRSERLAGFIRGRRRQNLVDDTDEMQTRAALALRRLEFDKADRDFRLAQASFNSYRGSVDAAALPSALKFNELNPPDLEALSKQPRRSLAELLRVYRIESQRSQTHADIQSFTPKLDLTGAFILQGRDESLSKSYDDLQRNRRNLWSVGLSFEAPLDFGLTRDLQRGGALTEDAATESLKRSAIDQQLSWVNERESLLRCAQSITLLRELEGAQRSRFASEERKYRNGRATLFVVLSAEQDWINAQLQRWGNELQCRTIQAQTRLFADASSDPSEANAL